MPRLATAEVELTLLAATSAGWDSGADPGPAAPGSGQADVTAGPHRLTRAVTLAFAGDLHPTPLGSIARHPRDPMSRTLAAADLTTVNLRSVNTRCTRRVTA
jgi:hypothetical protein